MSRAINISAAEDDVVATCAKHNAAISTIETLTSGGTRVVLKSPEAAETIRSAYGNKVITGPTTRTSTRLRR